MCHVIFNNNIKCYKTKNLINAQPIHIAAQSSSNIILYASQFSFSNGFFESIIVSQNEVDNLAKSIIIPTLLTHI